MRRLVAPAVRAAALSAAAMGVVTARWSALHWGATTEETRDPLPGDDVIRTPGLVATRAITVQAPPEQVWPWVVQLGAGRGGFYSYDRLENLVGCQVHSADTVVEAWQHLEVGDLVHLHPQVALAVAAVDPGRSLVLHAGPAMGVAGSAGAGPGAPDAAPYDFTWAFVLRRHPHLATRLIVRERFAYLHPWSFLLVEPVSAVSSVMSREMLRGIRARAERASRLQ
ncbi:SRPBCC family protein [Terrabacter sp. NPDC080008]|uniref:SRPBCC family protein n=1 Tax=Terrabacter sp. NPDC080008 TaxID=3155176 RepID=UPI00345024EF